MLTLGLETSCDETSASLTDGRRVLANIVSSSVHLHKRYGGVVPEIASRFHVEYIIEVIAKALENPHKTLKDVKLVAVTNGPGLVGALLSGISVAKALGYSLKRPMIGVNHILAHLYSSFLSEGPTPAFPFVGLVVSGGHTTLFYCKAIGSERLLGSTQDDAVGEAYDKVAKILGLGYPGGPVIDRLAKKGTRNAAISFPRSYLGKDSLDFSFSGIKTAVLYHVRKRDRRPETIDRKETADICYAFQEAALDALVEKVRRACEVTGARRVVIGGGVAANSRLRDKMRELAAFSSMKIYFPELKYCMDNAAMIGYLGEVLYKKGKRSDLYLSAEPNLGVLNVK
ncbi:MAG: tRNA (adenosine(37)-N6)-threonylcarbamoyltransferase complex transferase subunit TsaD [Candidatus Omnitrophica bacterium]|nr:tRNA (adenosine(37)-N6)-threonylcarbamoyltransferase complex transferase subunit TsaD [Candidatus Omnitrophota bacterium]